MQFPKCKLQRNAILARIRELHFFRVDLKQFIDGLHLENRMTVRKGIHSPGEVSHLRTNGEIRRRNGAGSLFGENGNRTMKAEDAHEKQQQPKAAAVRA
jgi:hypothetical protein